MAGTGAIGRLAGGVPGAGCAAGLHPGWRGYGPGVSAGPSRPPRRPDEGGHPTMAAALLMVGIVLALVLIALWTTFR